jgi:hypothetical protein
MSNTVGECPYCLSYDTHNIYNAYYALFEKFCRVCTRISPGKNKGDE